MPEPFSQSHLTMTYRHRCRSNGNYLALVVLDYSKYDDAEY